MSLLELNLDSAVEPEVVAGGEYLMELTSMQLKEGKDTGNKYLFAAMEVVDEPNASVVFHMLMLPTGKDERNDNNWKLAMKRFFLAFNIDYNSLETKKSDKVTKIIGVKGKQGWAILGIEEDQEYGTRNIIKRVITKRQD